jgi:hypothetical protein
MTLPAIAPKSSGENWIVIAPWRFSPRMPLTCTLDRPTRTALTTAGSQNSRALDSAHLFAGNHPKPERFGMGVVNRAGLAPGNFCWANSAVNKATLCSASAGVATVPRTCANEFV